MPLQDIQAMRRGMYQTRRDDANRSVNAAAQENQDMIQRRMSALGQSGGGAAMGLSMKAKEQGEDMRRRAMSDIGAQESADTLQSMEAQLGRDFASGESKLGRDFQRSFGLEMADKDMAFKKGMFDTEQGNKLKEMDLMERQFAMDKDTTEFNKRMAEIEAGRKPPGMLDGLGLGGLGIDSPMDIPKRMFDPISGLGKGLPQVGGGGK